MKLWRKIVTGKRIRFTIAVIVVIIVIELCWASYNSNVIKDPSGKIFANIDEMAFLAEFSAGDIEDEDIHGLQYAEAFQKSVEYEGHCYSVFGYVFNDISTARAYYTRVSGQAAFPMLWFNRSLKSDPWKTDYVCYFENNALRVIDERFLASSVYFKDVVEFINWLGEAFSVEIPETAEVLMSLPTDDISNIEGLKDTVE